MTKQHFLNFKQNELAQFLDKEYQTKQVYQWVFQKYVSDFGDMQNISKALRSKLDEVLEIETMKIISKEESSDGTIKYLFLLPDGRTVETVLLKMRDTKYDDFGQVTAQAKHTICVSTQVGCKVGCSFCLTAKGGFIRNLTAGEIVEQILAIKKEQEIPFNLKTNIVYMGMGEPLDNLENLVKAIDILSDEFGLSISTRRQTVSTSGIVPKMDKLAVLDLGVNLAISLHAVDDKIRDELIPMNKAFNIESIIDAVKRFPYNKRKRVMFEYLMIKDINDDLKSAKKLIKLLQGIKAKVNLIYFNPHIGAEYQRPTDANMEKFAEFLNSKGLLATVRSSRGIDISAACGQLREKNL
jgi:23S rRNA (adenine2503-C2)-methyltransferase